LPNRKQSHPKRWRAALCAQEVAKRFAAANWRSPLWTLAKVAAVFTPTNQQPRDFAPQWCGFSYGFGLFTAQESQGQGLDFGPRAGVLNG
jgi:hypothetical protein